MAVMTSVGKTTELLQQNTQFIAETSILAAKLDKVDELAA
jgi:hypothetical protein